MPCPAKVMAATHMIAEILVLAADHLGLADKLLALDQSTAPHIIKALEEGRPLQGLQDFKQAMQDFFALNDFVLCELERTICSSMATGGDCVEKGITSEALRVFLPPFPSFPFCCSVRVPKKGMGNGQNQAHKIPGRVCIGLAADRKFIKPPAIVSFLHRRGSAKA